jgi:branched-chain amino acid transport system permease protein
LRSLSIEKGGKLMVSLETDHVQLPGMKMHYARAGEGGNTVLFVHGYSGSWRIWQGVMEGLPEDFEAIAVDLRGSGDSEKTEAGYTIAQMSEDVFQFADTMGLRDFTMVGHSMGGSITINFALEHPELLKSIIMVDPAPADGLELPAGAKEQVLAVLKSRNPEGIAQVLRMMAVAPDAELDRAAEEVLVEDAIKAGEAFLDQAMASLEALQLGGRLSEIDLPALMVHGDRDASVPLEESVKTFQRIGGCSLQVFYGCGHCPQIECRDEFTRLLVSFVRNPRRRMEEGG